MKSWRGLLSRERIPGAQRPAQLGASSCKAARTGGSGGCMEGRAESRPQEALGRCMCICAYIGICIPCRRGLCFTSSCCSPTEEAQLSEALWRPAPGVPGSFPGDVPCPGDHCQVCSGICGAGQGRGHMQACCQVSPFALSEVPPV